MPFIAIGIDVADLHYCKYPETLLRNGPYMVFIATTIFSAKRPPHVAGYANARLSAVRAGECDLLFQESETRCTTRLSIAHTTF